MWAPLVTELPDLNDRRATTMDRTSIRRAPFRRSDSAAQRSYDEMTGFKTGTVPDIILPLRGGPKVEI